MSAALTFDARVSAFRENLKHQRGGKRDNAPFIYKPFSIKQKRLLTWWLPHSPVCGKQGIIADGAIRSGKTTSMSLSYGLWAMHSFDRQNFLICGKTIGSLHRNVVRDWKRQMLAHGYRIKERRNEKLLIVSKGGIVNYFHLFGGSTEGSQDLVQGITAAGVYFDEVALMPRSFVDQATGRCSVDGSKFWFNCNPANPKHWFKVEWIDKLLCNRPDGAPLTNEKGDALWKDLLYLSFTMDDNPSLTEKIKARYRAMHSGVFFRRFVLGLWCAADGLIYDMFDESLHTYDAATHTGPITGRRFISVDYGTSNPMSFLEIIDDGKTAWVESEYYYSSKEEGRQKSDTQYADDFVKFAGDPGSVIYVVLDPSAASFKQELRNRGYRVKDANNEVREGIGKVASMFAANALRINKKCKRLINELMGYIWDEKAAERGREQPVKANDHACDALRYGIATVIYNLFKRRFLV
ncbi:MAG: PBSX family phage terminase large subunit [Oscillospiraceae bacterium]|nr:PBSX family phage terminase large subunit [Oscillospiraceae bacterium]